MPWTRVGSKARWVGNWNTYPRPSYCIVCDARRATVLCDYLTPKGQCNIQLCKQCAIATGEDTHFCPHHSKQKGLFQ